MATKYQPSPERHTVLTYVSPNVADILFYEMVDSRLPKNATFTYGQAHRDPIRFPNHVLCYVGPADESGWQKWYYVAERESQDDYNFEHATADIGGVKFDTVVRTYVLTREEYDEDEPAIGSAMPTDPDDKFAIDRILISRKQQRIDKELDSLFVVERREYAKRVAITRMNFDEEFGSVLPTVQTLYYADEIVPGTGLKASVLFNTPNNAYWALGADGSVNEGQQLSDNWYMVTTTQVVPEAKTTKITGSLAYGIPLRSYYTEDGYLWPCVMRVGNFASTFSATNDIVFKLAELKDRDGTFRTFVRTQFSNPRYSGPTKMMVEEWWVLTPLVKIDNPSSSPTGLPESKVLIPQEIEHLGANYNLRIEPTLHKEFLLVDTIGTEDPTYEPDNYSQLYPATVDDDWPEDLIANVMQRPFRGGYRITVITAYRPDHWVPPTT